MNTNEQSFCIKTPDGREIYIRCDTIEEAVESARDLLSDHVDTLQVIDRMGKVRFFSPKK